MMLKERSKELGGELRDAYGAALSDLLKTNKKIMVVTHMLPTPQCIKKWRLPYFNTAANYLGSSRFLELFKKGIQI